MGIGMRAYFTIHAGEYLVGNFIESKFKNLNVWIPSKDTGIDLLVTNKENTKCVSLQVKFSKDFLITHMSENFQQGLKSCGWWTLSKEKIAKSKADYWVFVLPEHNNKGFHFIIIKPQQLLEKLKAIHGDMKSYQSYLWVAQKNKCWEARGLHKKDQILANDSYSNNDRDFSKHLNNWDAIKL